MIDITKHCFCDNCSKASSDTNSNTCYIMLLNRTQKKITLCSDCLRQITESGIRICEMDGIRLRYRRN